MIKNKFKEFLNELKKLKVQIILVLHSKKKKTDCKMLCSNAKLIPSDSEIDIKDLNPRIKTL